MTRETKSTLGWLAVAAVVFGAAWVTQRQRAPEPPALPAWQRPVTELSVEQQAVWRSLRDSIAAVEQVRGETKAWPAPSERFFGAAWAQRQERIYVNYVGEAAGLRWLVLFIEPEPPRAGEKPEPPAPDDEEHQTLSDGTALHVTVWTQAPSEPEPGTVLAFPAADGWTQRYGQAPVPRR